MEINGKEIAHRIYDELKNNVLELTKKGVIPHLVVLLIGNNPSSVAYVNQKKKWAEFIGAQVTVEKYEDTVSQEELERRIQTVNDDASVHAILIQIPLPPHLDETTLTELITAEKDIDGFRPDSPFTPPLASAVLTVLEEIMRRAREMHDFISWIQSKNIVLIGKGKAGGKPISTVLSRKNIAHTVIDSKTENAEELMREADIIITAVGKKHIVTPDKIKPGVILIGVGMNLDEHKNLFGDYVKDEIKDRVSFYTPTPGGIGPVNVACLLQNLILAANRA